MGTSQALEVAIGLVLMLFLISLIASAIVEIISHWLGKRAKDLEKVLGAMIGEKSNQDVPTLNETGTFKTLQLASGGRKKHPSYMSAKAFGEAVVEILTTAREGVANGEQLLEKLPTGLQAKLKPLMVHVAADLTSIRAELEGWFDDTMDRLAGTYKRWSQKILFAAGLGLAIVANASAFGVATKLWHDPATRATVAQAAAGVANNQPEKPANLKDVAEQVDELDELGLPIGWAGPNPWGGGLAGKVGTILGWVATALLVMLGAPFWFDVLTRLVSVRSTGPKPPRAPDDPNSATAHRATDQSLGRGSPVVAGFDRAAEFDEGERPEDKLIRALDGRGKSPAPSGQEQ